MVITKESTKGIKVQGHLFGPGLEIPENITLWCSHKIAQYLNVEIDDLFDVISNSTRVLDAKKGFHVYSREKRQLIYMTVEVDNKSADYGIFASVCWVSSYVSVKEANEFKEIQGCPFIRM